MKKNNDFVLIWVSCGITSAVAGYLAKQKFKNVRFYYIQIKSAHPDNERFLNDLEKWYGQQIIRIKSTKHADQFEVIDKTGYVNGPAGAACTKILKKEVRFQLEESFKPNLFDLDKSQYTNSVHGYEFKLSEIQRAIEYVMDYGYTKPIFPLIEEKLSKENCAQILIDAGIELPVMYKLGYNNNNCIGCVKGGAGYWNKIRVDFPEYFNRMAVSERKAGHSCINGTFLDQLHPTKGRTPKPIVPSCGFICEAINPEFTKGIAQKIFNSEISIQEWSKQFKF